MHQNSAPDAAESCTCLSDTSGGVAFCGPDSASVGDFPSHDMTTAQDMLV